MRAAESDEPIHIPEVGSETRWPKFCRMVLSETPVRGVMSYQLSGEPNRLALNLYADSPGAFDANALNTGALFAAHAGVLAAHADSAHDATTLRQALSTSRQIGAAVGILMAAHRTTEDDAFATLRTVSQHLNRKLRDVARDVTDTGALPDES